MVKSEDVLGTDQTFVKTQDGTLARKGSVAAMLLNARSLDVLLSQASSPGVQEEIRKTLNDVGSLLPALHAINLFEFFSPLEWLQESPKFQEGRSLILQHHPQFVDQRILTRLKQMENQVSETTQQEIQRLLTEFKVPEF